jgi:folate-dependent phosphoribosylglycinamide formyltransferase PurN
MKTKIALLVDNESLQEWERRAVRQVLEDDRLDAEIALVIVNSNQTESTTIERISMFISEFSLWKVFILFRIVRQSISSSPGYRFRTPIDEAVDIENNVVQSYAPISTDGVGNKLPSEAISALENTDIAIRFGFGIIKGKTLDAPTHGVLSYHHGDITKYRGRPVGFYEFINNESVAGVTVQRLSERLDAGEIVATTHCEIADCRSLREVRERLFTASPPLLSEAVIRLRDERPSRKPETLGTIYSTPAASDVLRYIRRRISRTMRMGR